MSGSFLGEILGGLFGVEDTVDRLAGWVVPVIVALAVLALVGTILVVYLLSGGGRKR